jgi:DNA-binding transcriptional LysR family regulator
MLNLDRLRALHAVADRGSVNAAAEALHVTDSAISQQLAKLEREIGQPLLERNGRGVRLTDAATVLVAHTGRVLSMLEQAEAELDAKRTEIVGRLTVAAFPTAVRGLVPVTLRELRAQHPQLDVALREQEPQDAIPHLVRGDLDLLIATDWANAPLPVPDGLSRAPIVDDVADVALSVDHPLASRKAVALDDLAGDRWITWLAGTICHDWLMHTLRSHGHEPQVAHTAGEHATQLALVAAGLGAAIIPRLGRDPVPAGVRLVPVEPALRRHVYALWRTETSRRRAIGAAVEAFQRSAAALAPRPASAPGPRRTARAKPTRARLAKR